jgi:signal transduction histidine kinase
MSKLLLRYFVLATLMLTLSNKSFSQFDSSKNIFYINNLPPEGILLDKGWKFHKGDDTAYAKPDYDDSKWQSFNPTLDVLDLPQVKQGIVWFRLHLFVNGDLLKEQLALEIQQSGASEIYLNGSLIYSFGLFDTDAAKVRGYDPLGQPVAFPLRKDGQQILAVRYALQPGVRYTAIFATHNFALRTSINTMDAANRNYRHFIYFVKGPNLFQAGILFILTVLHLSFFLFYRSQKANLYFSLFALFSMIFFLLLIFHGNIHWVEQKFYVFNLAIDLSLIGSLFMVTAAYCLLEQKRGRWYSTLMILGVLCMVSFALPSYLGWNIASGFFNLVNLEIIRISFTAIKRKKRGAWIMAGGSFGFLICIIAFGVAGQPGVPDVFTVIVFNLAWLSIPVATSIYLGLDFAFTSRSLQQKLREVQQLSHEKQQILISQKETLEQQVTERTAELNQSLKDLKETQSQLIQQEKMASLGELTAGIAHEIQNPLNFVNNFSDINKELLEEIKEEIEKANIEAVRTIANDLVENEKKINHHGKRADAIVKGMLQHSRVSTGQKEPTDVNALADEYLRLSYHGMRAKDKTFNATLQTDFDTTIGKINFVPQDVGRVLLNLFNNAFYAVMQKNASTGSAGQPYEPTVSVCTKRVDDKVEIHVKDNGIGIPQKIVEKIFQPFFTTKPTGQGTGLGLSLSYDIIKAHDGEIIVQSKEGEGSEFVIELRVKENLQ